MKRLACGAALVVASLFVAGSAEAKDAKPVKTPPGLQKKTRLPPGHAKKRGCLPPGLAKTFGRKAACSAYVAVDPRKPDQAWFLIGGEWTLRVGFEPPVREELVAALELEMPPPPPPPIPLPRVDGRLEVLFFEP